MTEDLLNLDPALLATLTAEQIRALVDGIPEAYASTIVAATQVSAGVSAIDLLPHQIPPDGDWDGWALLGGRGIGKSFAGSNFLGQLASRTPNLRGRIIAPTLSDAVNAVVLDPDSGILAHHPTAQLKTNGPEGTRVVFPNKATIWCVGTPTLRDVDRLRALTNIDVDLFEEAAANPMLEQAVVQANLSRRGSRLPKPLWVAMSTPRPLPTIKEWVAAAEDVLGGGPDIVVTRASTHDNPHTPDSYRAYAESLVGTRIYRQEILGEILTDVEGALWRTQDLDRSYWRGTLEDLKDTCTKIVVGVDPPSGSGTCGIVVVGRDATGFLWVLADYSLTDASPEAWAKQVVKASEDFGGALVVAEKNQGGKMVAAVLKAAKATLPLTTVWAAKAKEARAEPVAVLWEAEHQGAGLVPGLVLLEGELLEWVPGSESPDRLDAMVWASTYLMDKAGSYNVVGSVIGGRGFRASGVEVARGRVRW